MAEHETTAATITPGDTGIAGADVIATAEAVVPARAPRRTMRRILIGFALVIAGFALQAVLGSSPAQAVVVDTTMDCWSPAASNVGICGAGSPDVIVGQPVTLKVVVGCNFGNGCSSGFPFFTTDIGTIQRIEWDRKDGGAQVDFSQPISASGTYTWTTTYAATGAYQPEARVCGSSGCSNWDEYSVAGVQYDLDVANNAPPKADMQWWSPCYSLPLIGCTGGSPDARPAQAITFTAEFDDPDATQGSRVVEAQWDFDGNGSVDRTTTVPSQGSGSTSTSYNYPGNFVGQPQVRFRDNFGGVGGFDKKDTVGVNVDLDVISQAPDATMKWWSPCYSLPLIGCTGGSPDGRPSTNFTFSADFDDPDSGLGSRVDKVQWDFDGNGTVDREETFAQASSGNRTTQYAYGRNFVGQPQVRFVDIDNAVGGWDKNDVLGVNVDLDAVAVAPDATMEWWSPCYELPLVGCAGGSPDGRPATVFTFTASFEDDDSDAGSRVVEAQWDFDGNGSVDKTTAVPNQASGTVSTTHSYGANFVGQPQVRVKDNDGALSGWDKKDILFVNVDLDAVAQAPEADMQWWSPCYSLPLIGCSGGFGPDGRPNSEFTFTADFDDPDADLGSRVVKVQWDFDDNGTVDREENVTPAGSGTVTTKYSYGAPIVTQPQVRFIDNDGAVGAWDKKNALDCLGNCDLDVAAEAPDATMQWWSPCAELPLIGGCTAGSPDGRPGTEFTFTADFDDPDSGAGSRVVEVQWDFDGNGSVDRTAAVEPAGTGTVSTAYAYGREFTGEPAVRFVDNDGAVGDWDRKDNVLCLPDFQCDIDAVITPPDAEGVWTPFNPLPGGIDGDIETVFTFDARPSTDGDAQFGGQIVEFRWDFNGDGTIDTTSVTPQIQMRYVDYGFGPGNYDAKVTVVDNDGATDTDRFDDAITGLLPSTVRVTSACVGDQDGDGIPCKFDPNDNQAFNKPLNFVRANGIPLLTNSSLDAAAMPALDLKPTNFFGFDIGIQGGFAFANADIVPSADFNDAILQLWGTGAVGSSPDTAYLTGLGLCLKKNLGSFFGYDFGFCDFQASIDDDQDFFELQDEVTILGSVNGAPISYSGSTIPLVSGEIEVNVQN